MSVLLYIDIWLLDNECDHVVLSGDQELINNEKLEAQFHALRRLVASKAGFEAFTSLPR